MPILSEVKNISTALSDAEVQTALAAVQAQAAEDVAPIWENEPATLTLISQPASFSDGAWQFIVADTPEQVSQNAPVPLGTTTQRAAYPSATRSPR